MEKISIHQKQHLLVDLDTLLDTRMGTLVKIDLDNLVKIDKKKYLTRRSDNFDELVNVDIDEYKELYKNRDVETLKCSGMTTYMLAVNKMLGEIAKEKIDNPAIESIELHVNYYPYKLSESMIKEFTDVISFYTNRLTKVKLVNLHPMLITPSLLKNEYSLYATYDFDVWLGLQGKNLENHPIPTVTVNVPSLFVNEVPDKEAIEQIGVNKDTDLFGSFEYLLAPYVSLTYSDIKYFCLNSHS